MTSGFAIIVWIASGLIRVAAFCAVVMGIALLTAPGVLLKLSGRLNRWASPRLALRPWEVPRNSERVLYRHHRLVGGLLMAGAAYTLHGLAAGSAPTVGLAVSDPLLEYALNAALIFLVLGNALVMAVGSVMLIRPSQLKAIESVVNTWVSTRQMFRAIDTMNYRVDKLVFRHPRLVGLVVLGAGLFLASVDVLTFTR